LRDAGSLHGGKYGAGDWGGGVKASRHASIEELVSITPKVVLQVWGGKKGTTRPFLI